MMNYNHMNQYSTDDIIQILRQDRRPGLSRDTAARIRTRVLTESAHVTPAPVSRYTNAEPVFHVRSFITKPMLPIIIALALLLGGTGTALAADNAVPGDPLYGVDRALEQTRLNFTFRETNRIALLQDQAEERAQEYVRLQERNASQTQLQQSLNAADRAYEDALRTLEQVRNQQSTETHEQEHLNELEQDFEPVRAEYENRHREESPYGNEGSDSNDQLEEFETMPAVEIDPSSDTSVNGNTNQDQDQVREQTRDPESDSNTNQDQDEIREQDQLRTNANTSTESANGAGNSNNADSEDDSD